MDEFLGRRPPLGARSQLPEEVGQLAGVELDDPTDLGPFAFVAAVVRELVVTIRHAKRPIAAVAPVVGGDERRDPREIALEREAEQVAHHNLRYSR